MVSQPQAEGYYICSYICYYIWPADRSAFYWIRWCFGFPVPRSCFLPNTSMGSNTAVINWVRNTIPSCWRSSNIKVGKHNPFLFSDKSFPLNIWGLYSWYTGEPNLLIQYLQTLVLAMNRLNHSLWKRELIQEWSFLFTPEGTEKSRERYKRCVMVSKERSVRMCSHWVSQVIHQKKSYLQPSKWKNCLHTQILVKQGVWSTSKVGGKIAYNWITSYFINTFLHNL